MHSCLLGKKNTAKDGDLIDCADCTRQDKTWQDKTIHDLFQHRLNLAYINTSTRINVVEIKRKSQDCFLTVARQPINNKNKGMSEKWNFSRDTLYPAYHYLFSSKISVTA
jgi:hypothetical protein